MAIVSSEDLQLFEDTISEFHNDLARSFTLYKNPIRSGCPNSLFDPITKQALPIYNTSNPYSSGTAVASGPFSGMLLHIPFTNGEICPVCNGEGFIYSPSGITLSGRIWHTRRDILIQQGQEVEFRGDLRIKITGNQDDNVHDWLKQSQVAYVDGSYYQILGQPVIQSLSTGNVIVTYWERRD